jgi:hypothetical protein
MREYLGLLNAIIITDMIIIILAKNDIIKSGNLKRWYERYNISAVISDVLIIMIVLIGTGYIYRKIYKEYRLWRFIILAIIIQMIHDVIFYIIIRETPRGWNRMLDVFKDYAKETSYGAIIGDSMMIISACIIGEGLKKIKNDKNIIILIILIYLLQYIIYQ